MGLYHLWVCEEVHANLLKVIRERYSRRVNLANGRPGMSFRQVLVPGILRQVLNCGFDRLAENAKNHEAIVGFCHDWVDRKDTGEGSCIA